MVQLREGTQKIVDMYNDKADSYYMSYVAPEDVEMENVLDAHQFDNSQSLVNNVMTYLDRDDRNFIETYDFDEQDREKYLIGHIRANDNSDELKGMKAMANEMEVAGAPKKYFVSFSDLNDFGKDLDEQLADKLADGMSMNEVVENFNELSQAQSNGNERVEQLDLNLEGLDDERDLFPGK